MNIAKSQEFFNPITDIKESIHIIGCGAVGSTIIEMLTRTGVQDIHIWDFDIVSEHNLANQMFFAEHVNTSKMDAIAEIALKINPNLKIYKRGKYTNELLTGYIFLAVDSIELRKQIVKTNQFNPEIIAFFDFRMRLTDAQHYAATPETIPQLLESMNFTDNEAKQATPINACGLSLSIITTVRALVSFGLSNFINFIRTGKLKPIILIDAFSPLVDAL